MQVKPVIDSMLWLFFLSIYCFWSDHTIYLKQTEMTAEERRKKHQLELKEQLHEEAKVCVRVYFTDRQQVRI